MLQWDGTGAGLTSLDCSVAVKVWDIRNQKCIQTMNDARTLDHQTTANALNLLMYDGDTQRLFAASSRLRTWETKPVFRTRRTTSHDAAIVSALYNRGFNQVRPGFEARDWRLSLTTEWCCRSCLRILPTMLLCGMLRQAQLRPNSR